MSAFGGFLLGLSKSSSPIFLNAACETSSNSEDESFGASIDGTVLSKIFKILSGFSKHPIQPLLPQSDR